MSDTTGGRIENRILWWVVGILAAVVIAGGAGAFGYTQASVQAVDDRVDRAVDTNNDQNQRLAVVETQYLGIKEQLNRMEATLDRLDKERRDGNR